MSTTIAVSPAGPPPAQTQPAAGLLVEKRPIIGNSVLVSYYDGQHVLRNTAAYVLAIGPNDEQGIPALSVAFPSQPPDPRKLSGPRWFEGFERRTGVVHYTHPDATAGRASIVWGYAAAETDFPAMIQPEGSAVNPIFSREAIDKLIEEGKPQNDVKQVVAVQAGKAPAGVSAPVLTSEATGPSIADLDAIAAEQNAKAATSDPVVKAPDPKS